MSKNLNLNSINSGKNISYNCHYLQMGANKFPAKNNQNFCFQNLIESSGNKEILIKFAHSNDFQFSFGENYQNFNRANLEQNTFTPKTTNNQRDEYSELSFSTTINQNVETSKHKKSLELDFKIKYKTEKCKFWEINQTCKFGDSCAFAHGSNDIREKSSNASNYKTKKCKQFFENGYCSYGQRCQFIHKDLCSSKDILKLSSFSYKKSIDSLNSINDEEIDVKVLFKYQEKQRPRLSTFEKLRELTEIENLRNNNDSENDIEKCDLKRLRYLSA